MGSSVIVRVCMLYLLLLGTVYAETSPEKEKWLPKDNDLRILELQVQSYKFADVIPAYKYEDVVLLPLGALSEILELAINVESGFAEGFVIREDRTFYLDTTRNEVIRNGVSESYSASLVHELDGDIYVESSLLGKWLYMDFNINLYSSILKIKSEEKLPFIKKIEREERMKKALSRLDSEKEYYPRHHEQHEMWSVPFLDQSINLGHQQNGSSESFDRYQYTTYATADLLKHEAALYLSGNEQDDLDDFRFTLGRKDPDAELLGFMNATSYAVGNINETRVNMINVPGALEPGVSVGNYPLGRQVEYDRHRFIGPLLPGWQVELYQNNSLIGYQPAPVNGLYDFQDVPLLFGSNNFRLVFYGPNGQVREEEQYFQLDQSLTRKGQHYYQVTASTDEDGGERSTIQYDYGMSRHVSATFNYVDIPLDDLGTRNQHQYVKAGLRGFWQSFFMDFSLYDDSESGDAVELSLNARYGNTAIGLTDAHLNQFYSEEFLPSAVAVSRSSSLNIDSAIPPTILPRIPFRFVFKRDEYSDNTERLDFSNLISVSVRGFAVSNLLQRISVTDQPSYTTGTLQLSTSVNRLRLRGVLSYELDPDSTLTNASISADPGRYGDYQINFSVNHSLEQNLTEYSASANKSQGRYNLSFGARYNSDDEFNLDFRLSFGFGYEPRRNSWESNALSIANQGSVSARVFLDNDQDGIYSENDEPLENIGFRLNNGYSREKTAEDGVAFITGMQPYEEVDVVVAPESLQDPLWNTAIDGISVVPRPGHSILLDFPVFMSGEIDGTVYLTKNGRTFGVGKVEVELVDEYGRVLKSVETSYDGFYIISKVPTGKYHLRISKSQIDKLNLETVNDELLEISSDDPFQSGFDFTLKSK